MTPLIPGQFRLISSVTPELPAGRYTARLDQTVSAGGTIKPVERQIEITAPRFSLPGTEVKSVFPPPNATGAFETRLAQIVLKRRSLPWERELTPGDDPRRPWLALVLLTEREGKLLRGMAVTAVVPPSKHAALGLTAEAGTCDALETTTDVVRAVFPRPDELPWLSTVREVSLADTEMGGGDDDGFLSVVLCNRVPRSGTSYGAYLISLEHRLDALPTSTGTPAASPGPTELSPAPGVAVRFPVLATWSFRCEGAGDFQSLMEGLHSGSLGTVPDRDCPGVTPTGHVAIRHQTRRGEEVPAWYRSCLSPREVGRRPAGQPSFHADQARAVASDGIEDLTESAAFEVGRLLAMSSPRFLGELLAWREATMTSDAVAASLGRVPGVTGLGLSPFDVRRGLGLGVLGRLSADPTVLGPRRPLADVPGIGTLSLQALAVGLGVDVALIRRLLDGGEIDVDIVPPAPGTSLETLFDALVADPSLLDGLRDGLRREVTLLATAAGLNLQTASFDPSLPLTTLDEIYGGP